MLCTSVIVGMNGALNTLVSQAAGAKNIDLCLHYLNMCYVATAISYIPLVGLLMFSEEILVAIG